jgi:hypothetical protein
VERRRFARLRPARAALASAALIICLLGIFSDSALAVSGYKPSGYFAGNVPAKVAVDGATGDILLADTGNNRVTVYAPNGSSADFLTEFGSGTLAAPTGIAIDQSSGAVYVSDTGNNRIVRYLSDGLPTPTYTLDPTYTSPAQGAAAGEVGSFGSIAVDQGNGDLLVADAANHRVTRFLAGGGFTSFDGADSPHGQFQEPTDIAVDGTGARYVLDAGYATVEKFTSAGVAAGALATSLPPTAVTTDPHTGNVIVAARAGFLQSSHAYVFNGGTLKRDIELPSETFNTRATGLAVDPGPSGQLYATLWDPEGWNSFAAVYVFSPAVFAAVTIDPPSAITPNTVHVSGTVDPDSTSAEYHFEYSKDAGASWTAMPDRTAAAAGPVSDDLPVIPNTKYLVRLVATTADGPTVSENQSFTSAIGPPVVETGPSKDRTSTAARLLGKVTGFGVQATYHFEYGTTTSYGQNAPGGPDAIAGNGYSPRAVEQPISGLEPGTTYHYRIVATNQAGSTPGADRTFTTTASATARAYELVSPADKGGVDAFNVYYQASSDGNGFAFTGMSAFGGSQTATGASKYPFYGALRTASGWTSRALDLPQRMVNFQQRIIGTLAVSSDGTKAVVISLSALAPGAVQGDSNIYLEDVATGALTTMGTTPGTEFYARAGYPPSLAASYVGGTSDFSHVLFTGGCCSFLPGSPAGALYEFTNGQLRVASLQPDGSQFATGALQGSYQDHNTHPISDDGSHVFFNGPDGPLYVRIDGTQTELISESKRSADPPGTTQGASFSSASSDGNIVYFTSQELTDDSNPGAPTLYRYVLSSNTLTRIGEFLDASFFLQASADGAYVYFMTLTDLGDGGVPGLRNIYVWHSGTLDRIATFDYDSGLAFSTWMASANGQYFAFVSLATLSGAGDISSAPAPHREVYRYDAEADQLDCVSCPVDGSSPTGDAQFGTSGGTEFSHHFATSVTDDGRVFFDTDQQLSSRDTNSARDVYESDGEQATLISAGTGTSDSEVLDTAAGGRDVFFLTKDRLVAADTDSQTDVYDARVGGGIAAQQSPPGLPDECTGEGCRSLTPPAPPLPLGGGSESLLGPGNHRGGSHKHCAPGQRVQKVKGRSRCVKKHHQQANRNRRQGR